MNSPEVILEMKNVFKSFSGVYALKNVDMALRKGEVLALVGENGAGKSTLMNILSGVYADYEGDLYMNGEKQLFKRTKDAEDKGISIIHQELNLIPNLTVAENIFLGKEPLTKWGLVDNEAMNRRTREILKELVLELNPETKVENLKVGQQQLIEIARALQVNAKVLIMDEPTSAISDREAAILFRIIRDLKASGVAIIYISHKLEEVLALADRFLVLRDGEMVTELPNKGVDPGTLINLMVGRQLTGRRASVKSADQSERLRIEGLSFDVTGTNLKIQGVNLTVRQGEVLGIYGLMGAGRTELVEAIFGCYPNSGTVWINGTPVTIRNPKDAKEAGICLVPEDRKNQGLVMNMSVEKNTSLAKLDSIVKHGFLNKTKERFLALEYVKKLSIRTESPDQTVSTLSGGNQQKVVIAKWLVHQPKVLLLDEPTRGIDVGAKEEIYDLIGHLSEAGMSLIVVSSELPEILRLSHRVMVMCEGKMTSEFTGDQIDEKHIVEAAIPKKKVS